MASSQEIIDRELSWLAFNSRVLELAEDASIPLLERVKFSTIFSSNLDEFYMVRVASVLGKIEIGQSNSNSAGFTPKALLQEISKEVKTLLGRQSALLKNELLPGLKSHGIEIIKWDDLTETERTYVTKLFSDRIFPVLTPLAVDPSHPFPYISGLSLNLAVIVKNPESADEFFARVKVPPILSRFIPTNSVGSTRFLAIEELIAIHLQELFPGMLIQDHYTFRVTRNQDIDLDEDETVDLLNSLEQELSRRKFGPPVRLEIEEGVDEDLLKTLCEELDINPINVFSLPAPLDTTDLLKICDLDFPELKFPAFRSRSAASLSEVDSEEPDLFFAAIRQGEILLHHPYESFSTSVVQFLQNAAQDPHVLAIKQTLYTAPPHLEDGLERGRAPELPGDAAPHQRRGVRPEVVLRDADDDQELVQHEVAQPDLAAVQDGEQRADDVRHEARALVVLRAEHKHERLDGVLVVHLHRGVAQDRHEVTDRVELGEVHILQRRLIPIGRRRRPAEVQSG